jgi:hypothetical protein
MFERQGHHCLCAHPVSDEQRLADVRRLHERLDVLDKVPQGHLTAVVGLAVVACIQGVNFALGFCCGQLTRCTVQGSFRFD